jgi:colanic acid/amylovoran biosynthesis glycosyltransferase
VKVAYFVNQYPKVSHTFIRREILALEAVGVQVERFALRGWADRSLVDPLDLLERDRTRYVLKRGLFRLLMGALGWAIRHPARMLSGLRVAADMARGGDRTWLHHLVSLAEAVQLVVWMEADGLRHVHAHFGTNSAEVALLAHALKVGSYSVTVHGSAEWDMPRQFKLREKVRNAAFVVAVCSYTRAQLMRWSDPADWPKIHQLHCGLDAGFLAATGCPAPDNGRLVCIGRLCKEKAQSLLIDALEILRRNGTCVDLVLVGDGEDRAQLEDRIAAYGLKSQVRITGWASSEQVRDELLASRALVLASFMEAMPMVLMEALALQRPVVATSVGGIPELVRDGREGWLTTVGSAQSLAEGIERCLATDLATLHAMGDAGRRRVLERHRAEDSAIRLAALLGQVI